MIRVLFLMEQHIGHYSFYQNLRAFVEKSNKILPTWCLVTYVNHSSIWNRLPGLPNNIRGTLIGQRQVRNALHRETYDVAMFNTQVPAALAGSLLLRQPYIISTDITPLQYDGMAEHYNHQPDHVGLFSQYKHRVNLNTLQHAASVIPWSNWTALSLHSDYGVDGAKITVIPPGVDCHTWKPKNRPENSRVRILFVGGDFYRKGGKYLLDAFTSLPAGQAELILVTRTPIPAQEGVTVINNMTPNSPPLLQLYQSCDIFALPTLAEAFGIAAAEASAVGLPTIATSVGGLADIVIDGLTGFLVPPGDTAALTERLKRLITDTALRHHLGAIARNHAETHLNAQTNSERIIKILLETAG